MNLFLASARLDALPGFLTEVGAGPRALFVPTAANRLPDRAETVDAVRRPLVGCGLDVTDVDLDTVDRVGDLDHDVIVLSAGNPFHLLAGARATGLDRAVRRAVARTATYVGVSAGAMTAGPTLEPALLTSPFAPAPGAPLAAIGLTDRLVLPHTERAGRAERHAVALRRYGRNIALVPLSDDEALVVTADRTEVRNGALGCAFRDAEPADAAAIADTFVEAGRTAWASFLGPEHVTAMEPQVDLWRDRIAEVRPPARMVVATDATGVVGFVWVRPATSDDLPARCGAVESFYTRPRAWGRGIGRALLQRAVFALLAAGCDDAALWTEERNARPRAVYERAGWRLDGTVREREYVGVPIREVRYRMPLAIPTGTAREGCASRT